MCFLHPSSCKDVILIARRQGSVATAAPGYNAAGNLARRIPTGILCLNVPLRAIAKCSNAPTSLRGALAPKQPRYLLTFHNATYPFTILPFRANGLHHIWLPSISRDMPNAHPNRGWRSLRSLAHGYPYYAATRQKADFLI